MKFVLMLGDVQVVALLLAQVKVTGVPEEMEYVEAVKVSDGLVPKEGVGGIGRR